jgi:hypothetical protein
VFNRALNVFTTEQMSGRIVSSVLVAVIIFAVYSWYTTRATPEYFDVNSQQYEYPGAPSPVVHAPERTVAPSGPNPPSQLSKKAAVIVQDERPYDPQEQPHESAELPERLRNPERMFGPGLANDSTETVEGVTSYASQVTEDAHQVFGPEFAQNGGNFMSGVMANDTSLKTDYSSV